ncbi:hypothetical protein HDE_04830 [Halotydeus destructor]|nr:hypothetical protein HDE_04830 [Halotydeus destructor]
MAENSKYKKYKDRLTDHDWKFAPGEHARAADGNYKAGNSATSPNISAQDVFDETCEDNGPNVYVERHLMTARRNLDEYERATGQVKKREGDE